MSLKLKTSTQLQGYQRELSVFLQQAASAEPGNGKDPEGCFKAMAMASGYLSDIADELEVKKSEG